MGMDQSENLLKTGELDLEKQGSRVLEIISRIPHFAVTLFDNFVFLTMISKRVNSSSFKTILQAFYYECTLCWYKLKIEFLNIDFDPGMSNFFLYELPMLFMVFILINDHLRERFNRALGWSLVSLAVVLLIIIHLYFSGIVGVRMYAANVLIYFGLFGIIPLLILAVRCITKYHQKQATFDTYVFHLYIIVVQTFQLDLSKSGICTDGSFTRPYHFQCSFTDKLNTLNISLTVVLILANLIFAISRIVFITKGCDFATCFIFNNIHVKECERKFQTEYERRGCYCPLFYEGTRFRGIFLVMKYIVKLLVFLGDVDSSALSAVLSTFMFFFSLICPPSIYMWTTFAESFFWLYEFLFSLREICSIQDFDGPSNVFMVLANIMFGVAVFLMFLPLTPVNDSRGFFRWRMDGA